MSVGVSLAAHFISSGHVVVSFVGFRTGTLDDFSQYPIVVLFGLDRVFGNLAQKGRLLFGYNKLAALLSHPEYF